MIGDYNINYLENKEKQNLETIIQPYDLNVTNKHQATRIKDESNSFIDYIIIDGNEPLRYSEIFLTDTNRSFCSIEYSCHKTYLVQSNQKTFYCSSVQSEMLRTFEGKLEQQILLHAPIKTIFIRNNEPQFSLAKRFISKKHT